LAPWWPKGSFTVSPPSARASSWCPRQIPKIGSLPTSVAMDVLRWWSAAGSPGPLERKTPSGSISSTSPAGVAAGTTVTVPSAESWRTIVAFTHRQIQDWCEGQERDMAVEMMTLALTIVSETLFGFQGETVSHQVRNATSQAMQFANRRQWALFRWPTWIPTPSSRRFVRACQQLVDAVSRIIGAPEEEASAVPGLLTLLCEAVDEDGIPMSAQELRDHCLTLLLTEHETTGNALAWLWYLLGDNPQVRARLETELREQLGPEALTAESLSRLPYLSAVVRESLRLYPTVWAVVRQAVAPFHLRDIAYPSQVYVVLLPWVVHRQARCFPDPEAFRPERWLDGSTRTLSFFAYFPFCGGPRLCIASPFALTEAALVMGTICQQFRLESLSAMPIAPEPLVTLRPAHGVPMRLSCRPQENDRDPSTRRSLGDPEIASRPIWPVAP